MREFDYLVTFWDDDLGAMDMIRFSTNTNPWHYYRLNLYDSNHRTPQMYSGETIPELH